MKKWLVTVVAVAALGLVSVSADVTVVQTMTMEGPAAAMAGGMLPRITMRIKGQKSRADVEVKGQTISSIADIETGQMIMLNTATRTATVTTPASADAGVPVDMPKMEISFKPTGKTQSIGGQRCEEHAFMMSVAMAELAGRGQVPPETASAMQDVKMVMNGSIWIARSGPGAAEFAAFSKAALDSKLLGALTGMPSGTSGPMEKMMQASASAPGLPYLAEATMTLEGSGPMVEAMNQMGPMKIVQKISSVSTDLLGDELFVIPEGYTVEKK